jgi:universal stress protein E
MKDTPYDSDARRSLLSNTDWSLIRSCPAPLWLVKPQPPAARPRIVAAVDPLHDRDRSASLDHRILATAKRLGEAVGGVTHAFHAFDVEPLIAASTDALSMPIALPLGELSGAMHERHAAAVEELTMAHAIPRDRVELLHGRPSDQLIALTNRLEADLVVMGAVSRSGYERLFVGSTAEDVVDKLPCDVLLLKRAEAPPR